ncbi:PE-PPE domain-containing protein [Mycobacterium spongiae]|uniref:PE-PPE domain-containing protein n=1 Tax=Mycobacterium spongiae TaxID=886343 RepID=A0A975JWU7_9MYCO|nr:PE-PPE domain-containing protein [Mycobacterium spongiae]QUR67147.1 PE-PPE domain-containing protein [Mycobacterium spongiae]
MHFAVLPPEVNSARIFTGVGLGPMLAAATAWDGLAEDLHAAAGAFGAVTSGLTGEAWLGPASLAMTRASIPYLEWLSTVAGQANQTAVQARLAASVFEAAQAATVHPAMVALNRSALVSLVRSDLLGQNAAAIAAIEAEYEQIWAQDVAAMSGYHAGASAVVSQLAPYQEGLQSLLGSLHGRVATAYAASGLPAISVDLTTGTFNVGNGNAGINNIGNGNIGNGNIGIGNVGNGNIGFENIGDANIGIGNIGSWNIGAGITGNGQIGIGDFGFEDIDVLVVGDGGPGVTALVIGGTEIALPLPNVRVLEYAAQFIAPFHPGFTASILETPSMFFPFTGLDSLTFDASVAQGVAKLHAAIMAQHAAGNEIVVFGTSQGATVSTMEIRFLQSLPAHLRPGIDELSFTFTGNPNRPDGGLLARLGGFSIPQLGLTFSGATPADVYPIVDYSAQYDGVNDFPRYPLNVFSTANALAGILFIHSGLLGGEPDLASGIVQPVSSPDVLTTYILLPTDDLPLLTPVRAIPFVGDPLADLVQPNLRVLVELGYDRTAYQDVPAPFELFPDVDWAAVGADLQHGTVQGINDALSGLSLPVPPGWAGYQRID